MLMSIIFAILYAIFLTMMRVKHFALLIFMTLLSLISGVEVVANNLNDIPNIDSLLIALSNQQMTAARLNLLYQSQKNYTITANMLKPLRSAKRRSLLLRRLIINLERLRLIF